ncbi:MAG: diphosphomevalonate decarboxylase [Patescibacteria group bacterium]
MKATAIAPSNIAFIKYWGKKDEVLRLPVNGSISMNLSNLLTTTTVEFDPKLKKDLVIINGKKEKEEGSRVIKHLDRIRKMAKIKTKSKVVSESNFPSSTGLSSSASGFAALSLAGSKAAGLNLSEKELSILAREGSGSASRSIPDGFVEWLDGETSDASYSVSISPPDHWDIADVVVVLSDKKKDVSTTKGQTTADSSPFFQTRIQNIDKKIKLCKKYIQEKNFTRFGELLEAEALELHAIMLTSSPSLIYLLPESIEVIKAVRKWRSEGLEVYFTLNTGQNVHLICQKKDAVRVSDLAQRLGIVKKTIINYPARGACVSEKHLF